jgi:hypothetical protein
MKSRRLREVLRKFGFPEGELFFCREGKAYKDVAE